MELIIFIIVILISYFFVVFKLDYHHNKSQIKLYQTKKPQHSNYLIGIYLGYIKNIKSGNILFERVDDNFILHIENRDGLVEYRVNIKDIINKKINIKAYHTQNNSIKNHGIDYSASYFAGTPVSDPDSYIKGKTIKIKKAYFALLELKDNIEIELVFFNNPNFLLNINKKDETQI